MGQDPLAAARLAVSDQRAELARTADDLRASLDLRAQFRRNPVPFVAVGAGAAFLLLGGPSKVAGLIRRQLFPSNAEKAYDSLPKPMQGWVDHMAGSGAEARQALSQELAQWRKNPRKNGKISKKLAKQIAEGPPGPKRATWSALEVGATILVTAVARKAVERLLSGEPPIGNAALDVAGTAGGAARPEPKRVAQDVTRSPSERAAAGWTSRAG